MTGVQTCALPIWKTEEVPGAKVGDVSVGMLMRVMERRVAGGDVEIWVKFRVCPVGRVETPAKVSPSVKIPEVKPSGTKPSGGKVFLEGWHVERTVLERLESVNADSAGECSVK